MSALQTINHRRAQVALNLEQAKPFDVVVQIIDSLQDTGSTFDLLVADALRTEDDTQLGRLIRENLKKHRDLIVASVDE